MFTRKQISRWFGILGAIALFLAFQPYFRAQSGVTADRQMADFLLANPGNIPFTEEYRFGWADSPFVCYHSERTVTKLPDGSYSVQKSSDLDVGWRSWSSFTLVVGLGLLWAGKRLRPLDTTETKQVAEIPTPASN